MTFGTPRVDVPVPGAYDGGGRTEIAVYRPTTGQWLIREADGTTQAAHLGRPGIDFASPGRADGRPEIAVHLPAPS